jgi:GNAT superfamily N-acetyltransferase
MDELTIVEAPQDEAERVHEQLLNSLLAFNVPYIGKFEPKRFAFYVRGENDDTLGGISGVTSEHWVFIHVLWVSESFRGKGIGRRLLRAAENHARKLGCRQSYLDTYDFQARPFYEKEGYKVYGVRENHPPGHRKFHMHKMLSNEAG